jgi:hypothetical protein
MVSGKSSGLRAQESQLNFPDVMSARKVLNGTAALHIDLVVEGRPGAEAE